MKKYIILLLILLLPFNVLAYSDKIIPGGDTLGIEVKNKGVIIVGFYRVKSKLNKNNLKVGDTILDNVHIKIADSYATSFHINKDDAINHHIEASMTGVIIKED